MSQELQNDYLLPQVRAVLNLPPADRINLMLKDSFIPYEAARKILSRLEELKNRPKSARPEGLLIVGSTGNGKTVILREFVTRNPGYGTPNVEIKPVVYVESPPTAGEKRMLGAILKSLGYEKWESGDTDTRRKRAINALSKCQVKILIIDEIHNILTGRKQLWESLNLLKSLSNELQLPIVLAGIESAHDVVREDPQVSSRFPYAELPLWHDGEEYRKFLVVLESTLPLVHPSHLYTNELSKKILEFSKLLDSSPRPKAGILGNILRLVKNAALASLRDGSEHITEDHLKEITRSYQWSSRSIPSTGSL